MDLGFVWDVDKYTRVQQLHHVTFHEVVSAFEDPNGLEELDPQGNDDRFMLLARTHSNRILQIIYVEDFTEEGSISHRIITAFEASQEWRDAYQQ